jgi:hypothetical protein
MYVIGREEMLDNSGSEIRGMTSTGFIGNLFGSGTSALMGRLKGVLPLMFLFTRLSTWSCKGEVRYIHRSTS